MQLGYTQNIKNQKEVIKDIFTPDYVIKSSKAISIMIKQDSVLKVRDKQVIEYQDKIDKLKEEFSNTLVDIVKEKENIITNLQEIKEIEADNTPLEKSKKQTISGYLGVEVPEFKLDSPNMNIELIYDINKVGLGVKGEINTNISEKIKYRYYLNLRYKFL